MSFLDNQLYIKTRNTCILLKYETLNSAKYLVGNHKLNEYNTAVYKILCIVDVISNKVALEITTE